MERVKFAPIHLERLRRNGVSEDILARMSAKRGTIRHATGNAYVVRWDDGETHACPDTDICYVKPPDEAKGTAENGR